MVPRALRPDRCGVLQWVDGDVVRIQELQPGAFTEDWRRRAGWWSVAFTVQLRDHSGQFVEFASH